jgi:Thioredoxin domain
VRLVHQFALESDLIKADSIEAIEFPDLVARYRVYSVPKTVINHEQSIEGSLSEGHFLDTVISAASSSESGQEA